MQVLGDLCSGLLDCGLRMVSGFGECWCGVASAGLWCFELAGVCLRLLFSDCYDITLRGCGWCGWVFGFSG